jgi:hypothetical protein
MVLKKLLNRVAYLHAFQNHPGTPEKNRIVQAGTGQRPKRSDTMDGKPMTDTFYNRIPTLSDAELMEYITPSNFPRKDGIQPRPHERGLLPYF